MATNVKKKLFFLVFCLASVTQGMYSTYFVSILTTIERIYQIQSKTAGAIMSATELGQILGSLLIAYYGGKGNKPKWIAACMTLTAIAALISTTPHFFLPSTSTSLLSKNINNNLPTQDQLCYFNNGEQPFMLNSTHATVDALLDTPLQSTGTSSSYMPEPTGSILVIFFLCLLAIGFGSTAITTLGIPFIDDIVSKEESPLYLGLTIGLRIIGPALGFLLGSFCIRLDVDLLSLTHSTGDPLNKIPQHLNADANGVGAWWLGLIIISLPLLILALPMYFLSRLSANDDPVDKFQDITYQAAEDHDIGGSTNFQPHVLTLGHDLEVTSNRTCYSEVDLSSREILQVKSSRIHYNYDKNLALDHSIITKDSILNQSKDEADGWRTSCVVVNNFGGLESTSFTNDEAKSLQSPYSSSSTLATEQSTTMNLSNSLSRLFKNDLLLLRMLSGILHLLPIAGFFTFLPKYLEEQFRIAPSSADAISGLAGILFVGFGAFFGGMIIRILNVNSRFMTRWIASSALFYSIGMLILMNLGCPQNQAVFHGSNEFITSECLTSCQCSDRIYSPVCANGTTYMSPCLAGCKSFTMSEDRVIFDECGCSPVNPTRGGEFNQQAPPSPNPNYQHLNLNVATKGHCLINCDNLKWYIILFSIFTLIHASCEVGSMMFNLRCVKSTDRTLALGLITFASSLLGKYATFHNHQVFFNDRFRIDN